MKRIAITCFALLLAGSFAVAQETEVKKKVKIITIDENGNKEVREFEMDDKTIEWQSDQEKEMKIIVRSNGGEEEEIIIDNLPSQMRWHMDVKANKAFLGVVMGADTDDKGVAIKKVTKDSPAEKAGLQAGDVIYAINGERVDDSGDLVKALSTYEADDAIEVSYMRDGKKKETNATLASRSNDMFFAMPDMEKEIIIDLDDEGMHYFMNGDADKAFLGIEPAQEVEGVEGVMILKAIENSAAAEAGMQTGDVITAIDGAAISNFDDLKEALSGKEPGDEIKIDYLRMGKKSTKTIVLTSHADVMKEGKKVIVRKYVEE
jgi:S1-C subfamily serine protease